MSGPRMAWFRLRHRAALKRHKLVAIPNDELEQLRADAAVLLVAEVEAELIRVSGATCVSMSVVVRAVGRSVERICGTTMYVRDAPRLFLRGGTPSQARPEVRNLFYRGQKLTESGGDRPCH